MGWSSNSGWNGEGWSRVAAAAGGASATYVNSVGYHADTAGTLALPSGVAANDIVLLSFCESTTNTGVITSTSGSGAGWTRLNQTSVGGIVFSLWWSKLNSFDIANGNFNFSGCGAGCSVGLTAYRGATVATLKTLVSYASTSTTATVTGYSPASSKGTVFVAVEHNDTTPATLSTTPQTFVQRLADHSWTGMHYSMDRLSGYTNGNVDVATFTGLAAIIVWPVDLT